MYKAQVTQSELPKGSRAPPGPPYMLFRSLFLASLAEQRAASSALRADDPAFHPRCEARG
jgi:hypothetical protein